MSGRASQPELKTEDLEGEEARITDGRTRRDEFMDRKLFLQIQGGRQVSGVLRGYDVFLNLVMDNAYEELGGGVRKPCGMVVIRGNSVSSMELVDSMRV